jgi:hypothetical protein
VSARHCACGTKLSKHNALPKCATCERLENRATLLQDEEAAATLAARRLAHVWSDPARHGSPQRFLERLEAGLDELAEAVRKPTPSDLSAIAWAREETA